MRRFWIAVASLAASALTLIWNSYWPRSTPKTAVTRAFEVPAAFIENRGQVDARVAYYVQGRNANIFFEKQAITYSLRERTRRNQTTLQPTAAIAKPRPAIWNVKVDFLNSNPAPAIEATTKVATAVSYFRSERAHEWKSRSVACESIVYREVWPGIDLHFSGERAALKYQFVVRPGADPQRIRFRYRGANSIEVTPDGNVHIATPNGTLIDDAPVSWQVTTSDRVAVTSRFDVSGDEVGFFVGPYDRSRELIIDPATVLYSGYIGGNGTDAVLAMAVDPSGNAYIAGSTSSPMFPTVIGPDTTYNGETDAFVAKVNSSGTGLLYVGYLGGSGNDIAYSLAVDADGAAYVSGLTESSDFPVRGGPDTTYNGGTDGFVAKINPQGSALVYSGFVGGSGEDCVFGISLDTAKNLYITGYTYSSNFPVTGGPDLTYNGDRDGFVGKLNSEGTGFSYLGYLGGTGHDSAQRIVVDSSGASYVAGSTYSADYPATNSHSSTVTLSGDAFITKVEASGAALGFSRYLGGSNLDTIWGLKLDAAGFIYIAGYTFSTDFPVVVGPYLQHKGRDEAFVAKIPPSGDGFIYCGLLAGSTRDAGWDLAVDSVGNAYVVGLTSSPDFPIVNATDSTPNGDLDAFIAKVNARGSKVVFSTFLGGSSIDGASAVAVEPEGNIIVAGSSWWSDFPVIGGPMLGYSGGNSDGFITKYEAFPGTAGPVIAFRNGFNALETATLPTSTLRNAGGDFRLDPATAMSPSGRAFVAARDSAGGVWVNHVRPDNAYDNWVFAGGNSAGNPDIASSNETAYIAIRDPWNSYWVTTYDPIAGAGTWTWLRGILTTDPKIAGCPNGDVYITGKDNWDGLWTRRYRASLATWQAWSFIGGIVSGTPAIACGADNAAYVLARGPEPNDKSLWLARVDGELPSTWAWAGGIFDSGQAVHAVPNGSAIQVLGLSNSVPWQRTWSVGSTWQGNWTTLGGVLDHMSASAYGGNLFVVGQAPGGDIWWWSGLGKIWTNIGNKNMAANARVSSSAR